MNARTHGLSSDQLLIPGEDPEELDQLKNQYLFQIEPSTPIMLSDTCLSLTK